MQLLNHNRLKEIRGFAYFTGIAPGPVNIYLVILVAIMFVLFITAFALRRWKWISNLSLMAAAALFILLIVEFSYRLFFRHREPVTKIECGDNCYQHDSLLGFKPPVPGHWKVLIIAGGRDTIVNTAYTIVADTLRRGITYDHRAGYKGNGPKEVMFVGCSFTFGSSIPDTATLHYCFGQLTGISTINLGCPAYGLHQVYQLYMSRYAGQDNSNRVFVYSLLSDHFYRAAGVYEWNQEGPYYAAQGDSLIYRGPVFRNVPMPYRRAPYLLSFFGGVSLIYDKLDDILLRKRMKAFSQREYDRIFLMLKKMAMSISQTGGRLMILNWDRSNWGYQGYEFPFQQQLDKDVMGLGVEVFPVSGIIDYKDAANFVRGDGHPTGLANHRIAQRLNKFP